MPNFTQDPSLEESSQMKFAELDKVQVKKEFKNNGRLTIYDTITDLSTINFIENNF